MSARPAARRPAARVRAPSPADRAAAIRDAVAFIRDRLHRHRLEFCDEVGGFLLSRLFRGDVALFRRAGWKEDSIRRIARDRRVNLEENMLYACVHVHVLLARHGENAPGLAIPELPVWAWDAMWCLEDDPDSLVEVAAWATSTGAGVDDVARVAQTVKPWISAGGRLPDLLASGGAGATLEADRARRMLGVARSWLSAGEPLSPSARSRVIDLADAILAALGPAAGRR